MKKQEALTLDSVLTTRRYFADLCTKCIKEAASGEVIVNDLASYIEWKESDRLKTLRGDFDHTVAFRQYATYVQTGEMRAILN